MTRKPIASPRTRIAAGAVVLVGAAAAYGLKAPPGPSTYKTLMLIGVLIGLSAVPRFDKLNFASLPAGGRALIGVAMAVGIVAGVGALILLLGYGFKGA